MPKRQSPDQHIPGLPFRRNWLHIPADFADYPIAIDAASYPGQVPERSQGTGRNPVRPACEIHHGSVQLGTNSQSRRNFCPVKLARVRQAASVVRSAPHRLRP